MSNPSNKKEALVSYMSEFKNSITEITDIELEITDKIENIRNSTETDMKKENKIQKLQQSLVSTSRQKETTFNNLLKVKEKKDNITLKLDEIMFDNIVMLDKIKKNIEILKKL